MSQLTKEDKMGLTDKIHTDIWVLYKKIGGEYKSRFVQLDDMIKLGEMAQDWKDVAKAETIGFKYTNKVSAL